MSTDNAMHDQLSSIIARMPRLEREVHELRDAVAQLEKKDKLAAGGVESVVQCSAEMDEATRAIEQMTIDLFGNCKIEDSSDPETDEPYRVIRVNATGTDDEIQTNYHTWHRRLGDVAIDFPGLFRLSLRVE